MKTIKFTTTSWHYQLADFGAVDNVSNNICSYTRQVIGGIIAVLVLALLTSVLIGIPIFSIITVLITEYNAEVLFSSSFNIIGAGIIMVICYLAMVAAWCFLYFVDICKKPMNYKIRTDSFIYQLWVKFKEHSCVKIEFTDSK